MEGADRKNFRKGESSGQEDKGCQKWTALANGGGGVCTLRGAGGPVGRGDSQSRGVEWRRTSLQAQWGAVGKREVQGIL